MFITAGEVIEAVTGIEWDAFVREQIFEPLGMASTTTTTEGIEDRPDVATPHVMEDGQVVAVPWRDFDNVGAAGAVNSSAWEMAQWLRLQLGRGVFEGRRLLSDSVVEEMWTPHTVIRRGESSRELFPETHFQAYGLGWSLRDYRGRKVVSHGGSLDGMRTQVGFIPEEDLGVVVITNVNISRVPQVVLYHLFDTFLGPREKDWNRVMREAHLESRAEGEERRREREEARVEGTTPSLPLEAYAGTYADSLYGMAEVRLEDGALVVEVGPAFVGELEHWHFETFRARWRDEQLGRAWVQFHLDRRGRVEEVEIQGWRGFRKREGVPEDGG